MKVGLYISCYNAEKHIGDVLEGVFKQSLSPAEVVVVDDCSTDNTSGVVGRYPVRLIMNKSNKGLATCRNTAIKDMEAEFIASLDSDCVPEDTWLEKLAKRLDSPEVAGAGGKLSERHTDTIYDLWRSVHMKQYWDDKNAEPPFLFGSNTIFKKYALLEAGLYNEDLGNNYEDVDICNNLKRKRYSLAYEPDALVHHLKKDTIQSLFSSYWRWHLAYYQKKDFYKDENKFSLKIKDNIGLANRYIKEDIAGGRESLLYLDFLLAIDHCLRDFEYFCCSGKYKVAGNIRLSCWLSLIDLSLFCRLNNSKDMLPTIIPQESAILQNFFALILVLGRVVQYNFKTQKFQKVLCKDLLMSVYNIDDAYLSDKVADLVRLGPDWQKLFKNEQPNLKKMFLKNMFLAFDRWLGHLKTDFPGIPCKIEASSEGSSEKIKTK